MSLKAKLISSISAFVLVLALLVVGVFALPQANVPLGGTINFQATNVYAEITGTISGQENGPASLPKLEFSNNQTPDTSGWAKGDLVFDPNASPIQIQIEINVKNLSKERALYVKVEDLVGAVANLTKSVTVGEENKEGTYVKVLPLGSLTYTISLSPTDEGESVTGEYNYLITLLDETETQNVQIQANPNQETLGSISGGGTFDLGDEITLTATPSGSNTFLAWATSTDPNTMEILSTSATYSFELTMDSPRTYYALFNQTTSTSQPVGDLVYTFYNEAKLASVTKPTSTSLSGAIEIPSVVSSGENGNSYKVYSIGRFAFDVCMSLTSITIPEGVTSIEEWAFSYCTSLTSITLPSTLTSIGADAFFDCGSLVSIKIPEGVRSIGGSAFSACSSLTSITIPEGVTSIGGGAFSGCSSLEAFYGNGNSYYTIDDNRALIVDGGKTFLAYAAANPATSYSIPEEVTSIGNSAFEYCSNLTSITIPEGVTTIGNNAFSSCSSLTSITLPITLTSIGDYTFSNCGSLTSITIPGRVISIGQYAFNGCYALAIVYNNSSLEITKGESGHGRVAYYAKEVVANGQQAQGSIEDIGNVNYYINETTGEYIALVPSISRNLVTQIIIAAGAKEINQYAFSGCISLTSIIIPEGVTSIGSGAFRECSSLTSITIPEGVTSIGNSSFYNCSKLTSITIPEGVTSIGTSAFSRCSSLTSITLPSTLTSIRSEAFYNCSGLTEITINGKISTLEFYAFSTCTNLTKLTLGANVKSIPSNLFTNSNLTNLNEIVVHGDLNSTTFPSGNWYKNGSKVTKFSGAGTYTKQA